jgi:hypothetical protein
MQYDFMYANFAESFILSIMFTFTFYDRPPFWPHRHDILHASSEEIDVACWQVLNYSRAAAMMRDEIFKLQYHTLCEVLVFLTAHPAEVTITRMPERGGNIFLGIERQDRGTGFADRVWLKYRENQTAYYPAQTIASWEYVPIYIDV